MKELLQNKKFIGIYLLWCLIHFLFYLFGHGHDFGEGFWPITDISLNHYGVTEFLVYSIVPAALIIAIKLINEGGKKE